MRSFFDNYVGRFVIGLLLLIGFCVKAEAQVTCPKIADNKAHACWAAPTTNTDGTPITGAITYTVQRLSGAAWVNETTTSALDWTSGVLSPGTYSYRVLAIVGNVQSDPSAASGKTVAPSIPNPPSGFVIAQVTVEIVAPAYKIIGRYPDAKRGEFVALVPVGRDCTGPVLFRKNGYSFRQVVLKASDSTWQDAGPAPKTAAAPCVRLAS